VIENSWGASWGQNGTGRVLITDKALMVQEQSFVPILDNEDKDLDEDDEDEEAKTEKVNEAHFEDIE